MEINKNISTLDKSENKIGGYMDGLENKINKKIDINFPYEKNDNGTFSLKLSGVKLDLELSEEQLVEAYKITLKIKNIFRKNKYTTEFNKFNTSGTFNGDKDIELSNTGLISDIDFLTTESFQKIFTGTSDNNFEKGKNTYITFLNELMDFKTDKYINEVNKNYIDSYLDYKENNFHVLDNKNLSEIKQFIDNNSTKRSELSLIFLEKVLENGYRPEAGYDLINVIKNFTPGGMVVNGNGETLMSGVKINFKLNGEKVIMSQGNRELGNIELKNYNDILVLSRL